MAFWILYAYCFALISQYSFGCQLPALVAGRFSCYMFSANCLRRRRADRRCGGNACRITATNSIIYRNASSIAQANGIANDITDPDPNSITDTIPNANSVPNTNTGGWVFTGDRT